MHLGFVRKNNNGGICAEGCGMKAAVFFERDGRHQAVPQHFEGFKVKTKAIRALKQLKAPGFS
ncbi:MAG: hypothetical protein CMO80_22395 [Verrucomicrobiales bacterium]|nr:hypothetical protein [Verrucomicrobiales bacterium]